VAVARMWPTCGAGSRGAIVAREDGGFLRSDHAASVTRRGESVALATHSPTRAGGSRGPTVASDARLFFAVQACNGRDAARAGRGRASDRAITRADRADDRSKRDVA